MSDYEDTRLSFGISSVAEIFQNTFSSALEGLDGIRNISDDIIVFGRTQEKHDNRLERLFIRLIKVITKLPNSEQSYKGKVQTHNYINRQNQSTTGKL